MGIGRGQGTDKVQSAVRSAIESPLLETTVAGAKAILLNITGGYDMSMRDVTEAANQIQSVADKDASIIFGAAVHESMQDEMRITVIATGFENKPAHYADQYQQQELEQQVAADAYENVTPTKEQTLSDLLKKMDEDSDPSKFEVPSFLNK